MLVQTREQFDAMLSAFKSSQVVAFDTEATGVNLRGGDVTIGISLYTKSDGQTWYLPFAHGFNDLVDADYESKGAWHNPKKVAYAHHVYFESLAPSVRAENVPYEWVNELKAVWGSDPQRLFIGHNAQFDLTALHLLGFPDIVRVADTMAMSQVFNTDWVGSTKKGKVYVPYFPVRGEERRQKGSAGLKFQARLWNLRGATEGIDDLKDAVERLIERLKEVGGDRATIKIKDSDAAQGYIWMLPPSEVALYAEEDTRLAYELYVALWKESRAWGDWHLYDFANRITRTLWEMDKNGFDLDLNQVEPLVNNGLKAIAELTEEIYKRSGGIIDKPNSSQKVIAYLASVGIEVDNAQKDTVEEYAYLPAIRMVLECKHLTKLVSTYVKKWYENQYEGRIHPAYRVLGARTGRLTSGGFYGNMQNLPKKDAKSEINPKDLLLAPKGHRFVSADYSMMEVILAAHSSETRYPEWGMTQLTDLILQGNDMHAYTMKHSGIYDLLLTNPDGSKMTEAEYLEANGYNRLGDFTPKDFFYKFVARQISKTANFAMLYGGGVTAVVNATGCTADQAKALLAGFKKAFPAINKAIKAWEDLASSVRPLPNNPNRRARYIEYPVEGVNLFRKFTWYSDKRSVKAGKYGEYETSPLKTAARDAFNNAVQGSGALLMLQSILRIKDEFGWATFSLNGAGERVWDYSTGVIVPHSTTHDDFLFSIRDQDLHILPRIREIMTDWNVFPKLKVSFAVSPVNGTWGQVDDIDLDVWLKEHHEHQD